MNHTVLLDVNATNQVATITLNRPERRNAINDELLSGLNEALQQAKQDERVRAIVLNGAGKGFCAGADLTAFGSLTPDALEQAIIERYQPLMNLITTLPKPIIAAVNGVAAGAGAALALACDLRIMAEDASMMQAFSNIGLVPDAGATWFLVRMVGYGRAYELAAEGERLSAERCLAWGIANQVVSVESLLEVAYARAAKLAQRPTLALGLTKLALTYALQNNLMDSIAYEAHLQRQTIVSHDHAEGVQALLQKRAPQFTGK